MASNHHDLLLRETSHRCHNDLQMIVGLLGLQSRRARNPEVRQALADAMSRVAVLVHARATLNHHRELSLGAALQKVCEALHAPAEVRAILISLRIDQEVDGLSSDQVTALALVVNELATNALKHAFEEEKAGQIRVVVGCDSRGDLMLVVDDDGLPFPELAWSRENGLGLTLVRRLVESIGGRMVMPAAGSKRFEIQLALTAA